VSEVNDVPDYQVCAVMYVISTGEIKGNYIGALSGVEMNTPEGCAVIIVGTDASAIVNNGKFMIMNGEIVARPVFTISKTEIKADGVDSAVIDGLPNPCIVTIDGVNSTVTDGTLELSTTMAHSWLITIYDQYNFPFQFFRRKVTAI
jgi:hypothetical protein